MITIYGVVGHSVPAFLHITGSDADRREGPTRPRLDNDRNEVGIDHSEWQVGPTTVTGNHSR